jgi:hypothetical protein
LFLVAIVGGAFVLHDFRIKGAESRAGQSAQALQSVTALARQAAERRAHCLEEGVENFSCYESYYKRVVAEHGVRTALDDLKARYNVSSFAKAQCHQLSHVIGHEAVDVYGTPARAFAQGDSLCWSGYYHGVMEEIVERAGSEGIESGLDGLCSDMHGKENYSFDYYNCVHGLGHGVMTLKEGELFDALALCDKLSGPWEQGSCAGGVFMENVMVESRGGVARYLKNDDLLYPCNAVDDTYKPQCFLMQSSHMLFATGYDWKRVFAVCDVAPAAYRAACYESIGRDASGSTVSDAEKTKNICNVALSDAQKNGCVAGAARDFVSYHHRDVEANKFCGTFDTALAKSCRAIVASYYKTF